MTCADAFGGVTMPPRPPTPDVLAWMFVALVLGVAWGWTVFF